ncbi:hypothetical protein HNP84_006512 [Thermocatellispora tengchongensis]|uniref:Uncharacterized protein n=1 Tax=Thermocatellispora tengchongensis TaxID=1073253 RepID=A0A840PFZ3_9ACTN|nr:hypothetical protein [Thermocatellispora tengchongensis]MBB5136761.1 hypothetical protein [Thermocatellispora tengchongensis]
MLDKFWEGFAGKLADQWSARLFSPAFGFWAGGFAIWLWSRPGDWRKALAEVERGFQGWSVAALVIVVMGALAVLLVSATTADRLTLPALRLLEGYWPWWAARPLTRLLRRRLETAKRRAGILATSAGSDGDLRELARLETLLGRHPGPDDLLPTRLGNLLRLAEARPRERYGLDAVVCWPYLWLVLDDGTRTEILDARMALNRAARLWLWSALFAVWTIWTWWALLIALAMAAAVYRFAVLSTAETYGSLVNAAFALNRHRLYEGLRWPPPDSPETESKLGQDLTIYLHRGIAPDGMTFSTPSE